MKKTILSVFSLILIFGGCTSSHKKISASEQSNEQTSQTISSKQNTMSDEELCETLRSWGAADAFIDENRVLLFGITKDEVSADPDWAAQQYYDMAVGFGVSDLTGCNIIVCRIMT